MATQISLTVNDVLEGISDYRGESSTNTNASRIRAVAKADKDFAGRHFWHYYLLSDQEMVGDGSSNYTIGDATHPMRAKGLTDVRVGGTSEAYRYTIVNEQTYREKTSSYSEDKVCYEWYDATNNVWKVKINATPSASDTIYYSYYWLPPTQTLTTDAVITPNIDIQILSALSRVYFAEGEYTLSDNLKVETETLILEELGNDTRPAVNQTLNLPQGKGIGLY